jgi:hypothetical protein
MVARTPTVVDVVTESSVDTCRMIRLCVHWALLQVQHAHGTHHGPAWQLALCPE